MKACKSFLNIESLEDIYNFRAKIFQVVSQMANQEVAATRISSALSSHLAHILQRFDACLIQVELEDFGLKVEIRFCLYRSIEQEDLLSLFFDEIQVAKNKQILKKSFPRPKQPNFMELANEILSQKSKEDLSIELQKKNEELERSIANLKKSNRARSRMEDELNVAKNIQLSMLPVEVSSFFDYPEIDIYADLVPAREVGGDFYDYFFIDEDFLGITVGDVSGKGVPAALMMAVCKTLLKSFASTEKSTAKILTRVNNEMAKDNKNYMFVTVFLAILNVRTGQLVYTNAGHNPTLIKRKNGELVKLTDLHGPVVAAMEGLIYKESNFNLYAEDLLFAYTDGITDAHNAAEELFSIQRLQNFLKNLKFESSESTIREILNTLELFEKGQEQFDDITALCLQFKGAQFQKEAIEIIIPGDMKKVQEVMKNFETFAKKHYFSVPILMKINIVIDEIISNIIKYSFQGINSEEIRVLIELHQSRMMMQIEDNGTAFNPFQANQPNVEASIENRKIGGLGIHLVRQLMDEYYYRREAGKNILTMYKDKVI